MSRGSRGHGDLTGSGGAVPGKMGQEGKEDGGGSGRTEEGKHQAYLAKGKASLTDMNTAEQRE